MHTLFLDESGDHTLARIDPLYPVFVLGGVIICDRAYAGVEERVRRFKRDQCGDESIVLHTADITRNRCGFEFMHDRARRDSFYTALNALMAALPYDVLAVAVRKDLYRERYGAAARDPYHLALSFILERFLLFLSGRPGAIIAESRNPTLDAGLQTVYRELTTFGTESVSGQALRRAFTGGLEVIPKQSGPVGMELADLVVAPIGRHLIGKPDREDWRVVERRFRRGPAGDYLGYGLKVFP